MESKLSGAAPPRGTFPPGAIRQRDGARMQCPVHPDAHLHQGFTLSGQMKTWCTEEGCSNLAAWVPPLMPYEPHPNNEAGGFWQ